MSSVPKPLSAGKPSRSASGVVAKSTRGFQVFRIDGYSWTKALPGGERLTSQQFVVGGRSWQMDYYPNGTDGSTDDDDSAGSIALYLRMLQNAYNLQNPYNQQQQTNAYNKVERVRAQYKFSLLDHAGNSAYELPPQTSIFTSPIGHAAVEDQLGCGYASFITKEDLDKRRDSLLKDDCLAIRCDVGFTEVTAMAVAPNIVMPPVNTRNYRGSGGGSGRGGGYGMPSVNTRNYGGYGYGYDDGAEYEYPADEEDDSGSHKGEPDDKEYIRRCLSSQRPK